MASDADPAFGEERRRQILDILTQRGRARIGELAQELGVTEPTVRKDLIRLEQAQLLKRTHGGAIPLVGAGEPSIDVRLVAHPMEKSAIAAACLTLINRGDSIYLDSGTTVLQLAELLDVHDVNVLTSGLSAALVIAGRTSIRHTLLGGTVRAAGGSVSGALALENLQRFSVDIAFIGATGITADGFTVADYEEAQLKAAVLNRARRVVLAIDASKVNVVDFAAVAPLNQVDTVVTFGASSELIEFCSRANVDVIDAA